MAENGGIPAILDGQACPYKPCRPVKAGVIAPKMPGFKGFRGPGRTGAYWPSFIFMPPEKVKMPVFDMPMIRQPSPWL